MNRISDVVVELLLSVKRISELYRQLCCVEGRKVKKWRKLFKLDRNSFYFSLLLRCWWSFGNEASDGEGIREFTDLLSGREYFTIFIVVAISEKTNNNKNLNALKLPNLFSFYYFHSKPPHLARSSR